MRITEQHDRFPPEREITIKSLPQIRVNSVEGVFAHHGVFVNYYQLDVFQFAIYMFVNRFTWLLKYTRNHTARVELIERVGNQK